MSSYGRSARFVISMALTLFFVHPWIRAQEKTNQGRSIGKVSIHGNLIVLELSDHALGQTNLFDLTGRTLRFTPDGARYRVGNQTLQWDPDFGPMLSGG